MLWENRIRIAVSAAVIVAAALFLRLGSGPSVFERVAGAITSVSGGAISNTLLPYGENEKLKRETAAERARAAVLERENILLKNEARKLVFLNEAAHKFPGGHTARVTGRVPGTWNRSVTIDGGTGSGFHEGYVATDDAGLAGIVTGCSRAMCTVRLLTDSESAVSCMIVKKESSAPSFCIAYGNGGRVLNLIVVSGGAAGAPGDRVLTSGYGRFPRGIEIGTITGITKSKNFPAEGLEVKPAADFNDLEFLMIWKQ